MMGMRSRISVQVNGQNLCRQGKKLTPLQRQVAERAKRKEKK